MKRRLVHFLEDSFMRFFRFLRFLIPVACVAPIGRLLGALFSNLVLPYKRQILSRLRTAFPEKSEEEIRRLFQQVVRNGGEVIIEQLLVSEKMITRDLQRTRGLDAFRELFREVSGRNRGVFVVGGHVNNWEKFMGIFSHLLLEILNKELTVVVNRQPTPYLDSLVTGLRSRILRCGFIYTKRSRYFINQTLDQRGVVASASDVDYGYRGLFVPFMGRKISVGRGPAHYAVTRDVPLCFAMLYRAEDGRLNIHFEEVKRERTGDTEQDIYNLSAELAARVEYWIRRYPDQWFGWMQQPWKTQPVETLEAALRENPKDHRILEQMGQYHLAKERRAEAKDMFERALRQKPETPAANRELGRMLLEEGASEEAMAHIQRVLEVRPKDHDALKLMGRLFLTRGMHEKALGYFRRARRVRYDDAEAHWGVGQCLQQLGNLKKAMTIYRKGLRINDDYAPLHIALAEIYVSQPDRQEELQRHLSTLTYLQAELPPALTHKAA